MVKLLPFLFAATFPAAAATVRIENVPEDGLQPQALSGRDGTIHLVYLKGDPRSCDVRYVQRKAGGSDWSPPVSVNSEAGSAIAIGTIRGAQIALSKKGRLHVVWNGAMKEGGDSHGSPLYYTRFDPEESRFEPQRNVLGDTRALDGGASVASNEDGNVFIVWHGQTPEKAGEGSRAVFTLRSSDHGETFEGPDIANADFPGVCACCSLKALLTPTGEIFILYRSALTVRDRDMTLLSSRGAGEPFSRRLLDSWETPACPMSSAAMIAGPSGIHGAWETDGRIRSAILGKGIEPLEFGEGQAKHPVLVMNVHGETLLAWARGTGWERGGALAWVVLDRAGAPTGEPGTADGVRVWSWVSAFAEPDGSFVILR
ncbi:MAG TPA: hypothetical protein VMN36_00690 [Verrucomicrobiales bacterium]|nr:hypothetical protein [Verrucomicrobiales bacterium]